MRAATWLARVAAWIVGSGLGYLAWTAIRDLLWDEPAVSSFGTQFKYSVAAVVPIWVVGAFIGVALWRLAARSSHVRARQRGAVDATVIAFVGVPLVYLTLLIANFTPN
jgi:hypothetical protein